MPATPIGIVYDGDRYQYTITWFGVVVQRFRKGTTHKHVESVVAGMLRRFFAEERAMR
jgi:hypothetical protein